MKNLMYVALLIIIPFMGLTKVFAQEDQKIELGIKAGLNIANATSNPKNFEGKSVFGYNAGFFFDIPLKKFMENLYLQPGLSLTMKNGGVAYTDNECGSIHYVEIPVLMSYRYRLNDKQKIYVDFGPYFSYGLFSNGFSLGKDRSIYSPDDVLVIGDGSPTQRFDAGLILGAGLRVKRFSLGLQYDLGLTNILGGGDYSLKTRTLSINTVYTFKNREKKEKSSDSSELKKDPIGLYIGYPLDLAKGVTSIALGIQNTHNLNPNIGWVITAEGAITSYNGGKNNFAITTLTGIRGYQPVEKSMGVFGTGKVGYGFSSGQLVYELEAGIDVSRKVTFGIAYAYTKVSGGWLMRLGYNF